MKGHSLMLLSLSASEITLGSSPPIQREDESHQVSRRAKRQGKGKKRKLLFQLLSFCFFSFWNRKFFFFCSFLFFSSLLLLVLFTLSFVLLLFSQKKRMKKEKGKGKEQQEQCKKRDEGKKPTKIGIL